MSKRVEQKAAVRVVREQIAREERQRKLLYGAIAAVIVLAIAGVVIWQVVEKQRTGNFNTPATASAKKDGMVVSNTSGPVKMEIYLDYQCPSCKAVEEAIGSEVDQWIKDNKITLTYHPVAILDRFSSGTLYSTRSSAAAGCAADEGKLYEFSKELFAQQPEENSKGLTDDQIIAAGGKVGLINPAFAQCVRDGKYKSWAKHVTDGFSERGLSGTPSLFVNDKEVTPNVTTKETWPDALKRMVEAGK